MIDIYDCNSLAGHLVTMYIEKVFDSLDYKFILTVLKK